MYRSPSACEDRGQAAGDDIQRAPSPDSDVDPRQHLKNRRSIRNVAAVVGGEGAEKSEGGTFKMAK